MAGNTAKRHPNVPNPTKLAKYAKQVIATGVKNETDKVKLGKYLFEHLFDNDLPQACAFKSNGYYLALRGMANTGVLGPVTSEWLKTLVHTDTMQRVLESMGMADDYNKLSYSHRARFVGIGFARASDVRDACKKAVEGKWNVSSLASHLRSQNLKTGQKKMTPAMAKRTIRSIVKTTDNANTIRTSAKSTYRQMFKLFDGDDWEGLEKMMPATIKEWTRYLKDYEAEKKSRDKTKS